MNYPFIPKSTSYLEQGHYWPIKLENGKYASGVVLAKLVTAQKIESRIFYAGLLNWVGANEPTAQDIENSDVLKKGALHVKSIVECGSRIQGKAFFKNQLAPIVEYSERVNTMGYQMPVVLANKHFSQ
jgi:hypothetical protein